MNKVAKVTIFFWIMKIIATTLGETAGDYISMSLGLGYYVGFAVTVFQEREGDTVGVLAGTVL